MAKAAEPIGSDKAELKRLLKLAVDKPVHMALALGKDGKAIVKLDKMKNPKALEKGLKDDAPDSKNHRNGMVSIDPDDPKTAIFQVTKAVSGIAGKLTIALKGTGFSKIRIVMDDGTALEDHAGEDEDDDADDGLAAAGSGGADDQDGDDDADATQDGSDPDARPVMGDEAATSGGAEAATADPGADGDGSAPAAAGAAQPDQPDAASLTKDLTGLVKQMMAVIAKDPTQKSALAELATDAQASLKRGDLAQASAGLDILRDALAGGAPPPPAAAAATPAPAPAAPVVNGANGAAPDPAAAQKLKKSHAVWSATRSKIDADLKKLSKAILAAASGDDEAKELEKVLTTVVEPVLTTFDESLSDMLAAAADATEDAERQKLLKQAQGTVARYQKFVEGNKVLSHLDENPFVPVAMVKTLTATLAALSAAVK